MVILVDRFKNQTKMRTGMFWQTGFDRVSAFASVAVVGVGGKEGFVLRRGI